MTDTNGALRLARDLFRHFLHGVKIDSKSVRVISEQLHNIVISLNEDERAYFTKEFMEHTKNLTPLLNYFKTEANSLLRIPSMVYTYDFGTHCVLLNCLMDFTDVSADFAKYLGTSGIIEIILKELDVFRSIWLNKTDCSDPSVAAIGVLHNCAKISENRKLLNGLDATKILTPYSVSGTNRMRNIFAVMVIAYIVDESFNPTFDTTNFVSCILEYLRCAVQNYPKRFRGFSAYEIIEGLDMLANNENIRILLVKNGILPVLTQMMLRGDKKEEEISAKIVYSLALMEENHAPIHEETALMCRLERLTKLGNVNAKHALWTLEHLKTLPTDQVTHRLKDFDTVLDSGQQQPKYNLKNTGARAFCSDVTDGMRKKKNSNSSWSEGSGGHIMISYSWKQKTLAEKIKRKLQSHEYRVWIDFEQMTDDIIDDMAAAVEDASVILVCMSEDYFLSANCEREAKYASNKKKRMIFLKMDEDYEPKGWLGFLLSSHHYIKFSDPYSFEENIQKLMERIGHAGK